MGSPLRLTVVGIPEPRASAAWEAVSAAFEELEQALSRFRPTSDLVILNRRAGDPGCSPVRARLYEAVATAERAWRRTAGAFDPRVLGDLERLGYRGADSRAEGGAPGPGAGGTRDGVRRRPLAASRAAAAGPRDRGPDRPGRDRQGPRAPVGIRSRAGSVARDREGPRPRRRRRRYGQRYPAAGALLEAGGDLVARGAAPQPGPWLVGIEMPGTDDETAVLAVDRAPSAPRRLPSTPGPRPTASGPPPRRPAHGRARWRRPAGRDRGGAGSRLGRGLVEDPLPRGRRRDRQAGEGAGPGGLVDPGRRAPRDDPGRAAANGLAGRRGLTARAGGEAPEGRGPTRCGIPRRRR